MKRFSMLFVRAAANAQHVRNRELECEESKYKGCVYDEKMLLLVQLRLELEVKKRVTRDLSTKKLLTIVLRFLDLNCEFKFS